MLITYPNGWLTTLRLIEEKDAPDFVRWFNDPRLIRFLKPGRDIMTLEKEREWIANAYKNDKNLPLGIVARETGQLIGSIGLHRIERISRVAVTGTFIGNPKYWGGGYGTDAKMLLLQHAFHTLNLRKICSASVAFNERSYRYQLRTGYREEARRKNQFFIEGRYVDEVWTACYREDWEPIWEIYRATGQVR